MHKSFFQKLKGKKSLHQHELSLALVPAACEEAFLFES